ncbi:MAG: response regulator transcription factor [Spirochaetaceae bacterium]|jgi:DNA-binding response OmpR family regulator|nr:response regulator transcription factor [Spirochaetaceae bacterium]
MSGGGKVLVVDDEEKILDIVKAYLEVSGFSVFCARTGNEALSIWRREAVDLVLLDLMLPDISGETVCRKIREVSAVPVIMLTAKADEESIVAGLNRGADDYVVKPFSPKQLIARVEAVLRRAVAVRNGAGQAAVLSSAGLTLNAESRTVRKDGCLIPLTASQFDVLTLLMARPAKIWTRDEIIEAVKGDDFDGFDRAIDTHIKNLRQKLGDDPKSPRYIVTVYGMGYRFGGMENG